MRIANGLLLGGLLALSVAVWTQVAAGAQADAGVPADTQTPSLTAEPLILTQPPLVLDVAGTVSFGARYGFGDGRGLAQKGYSQGFQFNQLLALNLEGDLPVTVPFVDLDGVFSISAQLNSQQADNLQSLAMHFESVPLLLDFGDFLVGANAPQFIVPGRKLKGFKAQILRDDYTVTGAFARVEGIAESKTFRGNTSSGSVIFSAFQADRPWLAQLYFRNLSGLQYYELASGFIEGFTKVELNLNPGEALTTLLNSYELDYLLPALEADGPTGLDEAQFEIVRSDGETQLVLKRETFNLLRSRLRLAIDEYNLEQKLEGEDRKNYPFNEETDFELGFLQQFETLAALDLDETQIPLGSYQRQRFFFLGHQEIDPDSLQVEVSVDGQFVELSDPRLLGYAFTLFAEQGLADFQFLPEFFENTQHQIRASYNYTSTSGIYILGLSIVKDSDRVFLNGTQLQRDTDYTIDYETGALILFKQVAKEDVLRIEYEVLRGGLGGFSEYQRNLSQLSLEFNPAPWFDLNLDLFQGADSNSGADRQRLRTMPNSHTVAGLRMSANLDPLELSLVLGYSLNAYPADNNSRINLPNRINAIQTLEYGGRTLTLFAHQNGLTVFDGVRWTLYNTRSGLSGRSVFDIAVAQDWVALATETGLTLVRLQGDDPFALISNWRRFYQQDGLADNRVFAVAFADDWLWLGTRDGFTKVNANVDAQAFDAPENWTSYQQETMEALLDEAIAHLAVADGLIYLGSESGLQIFDPLDERLETDAASLGGTIHDLSVNDGTVYAAGDWGLRTLTSGQGSGWLVSGQPVYAVAATRTGIWYAPERGLKVIGSSDVPRELREVTVRALAVQNRGVWVGPVGGVPPQYPLGLTFVGAHAVQTYNSITTRIDGRDFSRFRDTPLLDKTAERDHLDLGWLGRLQLRYHVGNFSLQGGIEGISEEYSAIGSSGLTREDYLRWRLRGDYIVSPGLLLYAEHISGLGNASLTDNLGLTWKAGPQFSLDYSEEYDPSRDLVKAHFSVDLSEKFLEESLKVRIKLDDAGTRSLRSDSRSQDLTLSAALEFEPNDVISLAVDFRSPLRLRTHRDPSGRVKLGGEANWRPHTGVGDLRFSYQFDQDFRFSRSVDEFDHELEASMNWQSFTWIDVLFISQSSVSFQQRAAGLQDQFTIMSLNNSVQTRWEQLNVRLRWGRDQNHNQIIQTEEILNNLSLQLDFRGFENFSPGVDWTINTVELKHAARDNKFFLNQQLSARLGWSWTPDPKLSVTASTSANFNSNETEDTMRYAAQSTTSYGLLESLNVSLSFNGNWELGTREEKPVNSLSFDSTVQGNWQLNEDWTATFSTGMLFRQDAKNPTNNYLSYVAAANASMSF